MPQPLTGTPGGGPFPEDVSLALCGLRRTVALPAPSATPVTGVTKSKRPHVDGCREPGASGHTGQQPKASSGGRRCEQAAGADLASEFGPVRFARRPWLFWFHFPTGKSLSPRSLPWGPQEALPWPPPDPQSPSQCQAHGGHTLKAEQTSESSRAWRCPSRVTWAGSMLPPWRPAPPVAFPPDLDFTLRTGSQLCCAPGPQGATGCLPSGGETLGRVLCRLKVPPSPCLVAGVCA